MGVDVMPCRAERNTNPCNIRIGNHWLGLLPWTQMDEWQRKEKAFAVFESPAYGFRAAAILLGWSYPRDGATTLTRAIERWAPPSENDTLGYIVDVVKRSGLSTNWTVDLSSSDSMHDFLDAIAFHESGERWWRDADLLAGLTMAQNERYK